MVGGAVHSPPYRAVIELIGWVTQRDNWHLFNGWSISRGIHWEQLSAAQFCDLVHFYIIRGTKPEDHQRINSIVTGPLTAHRKVDEQVGFVPPSWWRGDDYASQASLAATMTLKREK